MKTVNAERKDKCEKYDGKGTIQIIYGSAKETSHRNSTFDMKFSGVYACVYVCAVMIERVCSTREN